MLYVDQTPLSDGLKSLVRVTLLLAPILVSLGFFLSVLSPKAERPNGLINLIYVAALLLAVGVVTLGIGLFQGLSRRVAGRPGGGGAARYGWRVCQAR
jgi:hypothetical protein